jgi:hypothetical protein
VNQGYVVYPTFVWTSSRESSLGRIAHLKIAVAVLALTFLCVCPAALAIEQDCMATYYREKSRACLDNMLEQFRQMPSNSSTGTMTGFLAQLFKDSPQERERILRTEPSAGVRQTELFSLYVAGLVDEAQTFAAANNLVTLSEKVRSMHLVPLDAARPSSEPAVNDLLIGAYMASGDTWLIRHILENFSSADDSMVRDSLRIGMMQSKFGPSLAPKDHQTTTMQTACEKYQCKADKTKLLRIMTLASAVWALQSLAAKDDGVRKTLSDFFEHDARLKSLYDAERIAFGNYLAAVTFVTALKYSQSNAGQNEGFAAMSKAASIYENLGSPSDAFAPMAPFKTK